ncbi:Ger(x)C family spore germination protein [Paenibacillus sp. CAU 1782]
MRKILCRIRSLVLVLLLVVPLGGCGFKDIDKRFFVVGTGLDLSGNKEKPYRITIQLAIPSPKIEPGTSKFQFETIDAVSIAEGLRMLKAYVDKELDFGHCRIFLIGESLARQNITPVLDWMKRRRDIQMVAMMAIGKPDAASVLKIKPISEQYPGNALLLSFGADGTESSYNYAESLSGFSRRLTERGFDPALAIVKGDKKLGYIINEIALMDKQRIKLILSPDESQMFNQLASRFTKASMHGIFRHQKMVVAINQLHSRFRIENRDDQDVIKVNMRMKTVVEESAASLFDKDLKPIESELEKSYEAEANKLLVKIQKANVDPLGFGLRYLAMHSGDQNWERWQQLYPEASFQVNVRLIIEGTGLIR